MMPRLLYALVLRARGPHSILAAILFLWSTTITASVIAADGPATRPTRPPNVLLIVVDDLRPQLGCYGHAEMKTPNIDRFAGSGIRMMSQYVAAPMCGPSRAAMLTGLRPRTQADLGNDALARLRKPTTQPAESAESVVELFRRSGYRTVGIGKITHSPDGRVYGYDKPISDVMEMPHSWDSMYLPYGKWKQGWQSFFAYADGSGRTDRLERGEPVPAFEAADVADEGYPDGLIARAAAKELGELKAGGRPFFLAVGLFKPHLPFNAPKRYWDLYDKVTPSPTPDAPSNVHPKLALHDSFEAAQYTHPENWRRDPLYASQLRHGYFAAVSYVDAQVGVVLDALEREQLAQDTIVILWGDHGFHLGDLNVWGKHTLFDWSLHSPLIFRVPGTTHAGAAAEAIVESIDIYPTLADLCGLTPPPGLDGQSLRPLLEDPSRPSDRAAISYWNNGAVSLRTDHYRLTRYHSPTRQLIYELYDVQSDPSETRNIAANHADLVADLAKQLPPSE